MNKIASYVLELSLKSDNITLPEIYSTFYVQDIPSLIDLLKEEINGNFADLLIDSEFITNYHLFFNCILEHIRGNIDDLLLFHQYLERTIKDIKSYLKIYTKGGKAKDGNYHKIHSLLLSKLISTNAYIKAILEGIEEIDEHEEFTIVWFLTTNIRKIDYLFRIVELHPNYVNVKNKNGVPLFRFLMEYIYANLRFWDEETIKYYKRVIVLLLESDDLNLPNEDLFAILEMTEKNLMSSSSNVRAHIKFFLSEINSHYELINKDSRINARSFVSKECPLDIIIPSFKGRVDLRSLFTITIDNVKKHDFGSYLFEDAYSLVELKNGAYELYIHVPDVGAYVAIDSETDNFMRSLGESVYAHNQRTDLLNIDLSRELSLYRGETRPAISFIIRIDASGNVVNIRFKETLIKVNYNLSRRQAEVFMKYSKDSRLYILNRLYEVAAGLRKARKEKIGVRDKTEIIMDEMNIWPDILTAEYCMDKGIVFPYKNYLGLRNRRNVEFVSSCEEFARARHLSDAGKDVLYSIFDINNRVFYDTTFYGNKTSHNRPIGNVGNPLREYISLETDRMIKDVIIRRINNREYWAERLEKDCIEYTETSAKIKQLYHR